MNGILLNFRCSRNGIIEKIFWIAFRWDLRMLLGYKPLEELRIIEIEEHTICRRRSWPYNFVQIAEVKIWRWLL